MTAKEALRELIDSLSDEDAADLLDEFRWRLEPEETLTDEEIARVLDGEAEIARGEWVDWEDVKRELNL